VGVSDSGPPIDDGDLAFVFRPFASPYADAPWETGAPQAGLALVKQLVKHQGGDIRVERPAEGGNTLVLSLPRWGAP